ARPVGEAVAPSCPGVGLRAPTDHTANARGIVVTVDGPKPTDTQRHREGRGENGKQRTTAAPVRAHHESSAGKHHITAAHQSKEFLGRRDALTICALISSVCFGMLWPVSNSLSGMDDCFGNS